MRTLVTRVLWIAGVGALLYGGFVAYERWWDGDLILLKERVLSFVNDRAEDVKERAEEVGGEALQSAKEEATEAAKGAIASAVGGVIESIGETIKAYGESVAGLPAQSGAPAEKEAPAVSGPSFTVPPPPVALSVKVDTPLSFTVNDKGPYSVAWGDGTTGEGVVAENTAIVISHTWKVPGDYAVVLETKGATGTYSISFPVRVYE